MHLNLLIKETIEVIALCDRAALLVSVYVNLWCFWEQPDRWEIKEQYFA